MILRPPKRFGYDAFLEAARSNSYLKPKVSNDGNSFTICCINPAHKDDNPSYSVSRHRNGVDFIGYCFVCGIDFEEQLKQAKRLAGHHVSETYPSSIIRPSIVRSGLTDDAKREMAGQLWRASCSLTEAPRAKAYFKDRGLSDVVTISLRFHSSLRHPTKQSFPAIIAKVANLKGELLAIQRTYLSHEGSGKAPVDEKKLTLGNMEDGAVQLAEAGPGLIIGEGIEDYLTAMQETRLPAWASLGAKRIAKINLPDIVREVIILMDNDETGIRAAHAAGRRWQAEGRKVRLAAPPAPYKDWNDMLKAEAAR